MDHDRLCAWLGLPPGSWPPDHYALLGLTQGTGDFAEIETRVLDRMELLRPHQLLHPDVVTEGMNRLAQALVCLTDPVERALYDRSLGIAPPPFEVVEDEPEEIPVAPTSPAYEVVEGPKPPAYEVVPDEARPAPPPLPAFEVIPDEELEPQDEEPELIPLPVAEEEVEATAPKQLSRRAIYRRLAAIRKALRAWEGLRPVLGTPTEALATPVAVLLFVQALTSARESLPGVAKVIRGPNSPGGTVAALVRLPHVLHTVRTLLPSQRQVVARDWQRGYNALRREQTRLRELAWDARPRRPENALGLLRAVRRTPEWVLLVVAVVVIFLAILRRTS